MKYLSFFLCVLMTACSTVRLITSTADIAQKIDDGKSIEKINSAVVELQQTASNLNSTVVTLNGKLPSIITNLDNATMKLPALLTHLDNLEMQLPMTLNMLNGVGTNLNAALQTWNLIGIQLSGVLTNADYFIQTWGDVGYNMTIVSSNANHLVQTLDRVGAKAEQIENSLQGKTPSGETTWWAKVVKDIAKPLLEALKYGAIILCLILGRMLWTISRKMNEAGDGTKAILLNPNDRKGRWSKLALKDLCHLQNKLSPPKQNH